MSKKNWINKCLHWKKKWPVYLEQFNDDKDGINLYYVIESLNYVSKDDDIFVTDAGTAYYVASQNLNLIKGQKLIFPGAQADMGFSLPGSIGVGLAAKDRNVIVITGDGSFNTNIQELATIKANNVKSKFIILNNDGYLSIRNTQAKFYNGHIYGESTSTGLWFPSLRDIANTYHLEYYKADNNAELKEVFKNIHNDECAIYDIKCKYLQEVIPTLSLKQSENGKMIQCGLNDMYPFLSDEELKNEIQFD